MWGQILDIARTSWEDGEAVLQEGEGLDKAIDEVGFRT